MTTHFHPIPAFGWDTVDRQKAAVKYIENQSGQNLDPMSRKFVYFGNAAKLIALLPVANYIIGAAQVAFGLYGWIATMPLTSRNGKSFRHEKIDPIIREQYQNHIFRGILNIMHFPLLLIAIDTIKWASERSSLRLALV